MICVGGDIHRRITDFYDGVLAFEEALGCAFSAVLHVGDFGVWPDPQRIDRATRKHDGAGEFARWRDGGLPVPRRTIFIKGNHEDFDWLAEHGSSEVLPGPSLLANGETRTVTVGGASIVVGGIGGCWSPRDFERASSSLQGRERSHYTRDEIERLLRGPPVDLLLLHDAPAGVRFGGVDGRRSYVSEAGGLAELVARLRPQLCFFGHHHEHVRADVGGVPCIGLNLIGGVGHLVAVDADLQVVATWPE